MILAFFGLKFDFPAVIISQTGDNQRRHAVFVDCCQAGDIADIFDFQIDFFAYFTGQRFFQDVIPILLSVFRLIDEIGCFQVAAGHGPAVREPPFADRPLKYQEFTILLDDGGNDDFE